MNIKELKHRLKRSDQRTRLGFETLEVSMTFVCLLIEFGLVGIDRQEGLCYNLRQEKGM
jgi:hypothetical protein